MTADKPLPDVKPEVLEYISQHETLTLATASRSGVPHAATLLFANDGLRLYLCLQPGTMTGRHVDQNPVVAFTVDEYNPDWSKTRGVQGSGEARALLDAEETRRAQDLFRAKYPPLKSFDHASLYVITPSEVHYINNAERGDRAGEQGISYRRSLVYSVFRDLPQHEVDTLAANLETVQFAAGETVVRQGAPADKFFIIVDGDVEVVRDDDGEARRIATLHRGQFFGEIAILRDLPRTATVRALSPTTLLAMERDTFQHLVAQALATTEDFDRVIQQRLQGITGTG